MRSKNFTISAQCVAAAMVMQAKSDVRYYLNGVLIGAKKVVATDGHRLIVIECDDVKFKPEIFRIEGTILKSAHKCEFVFNGKGKGFVVMTNEQGRELSKVLKFHVIDGEYPDWKRVMPKGEPINVSATKLNAKYVADIAKAGAILNPQFNAVLLENYENDCVVADISSQTCAAKCIVKEIRQ